MAKILVADDNSNVQKTVVLALTELGVEIASVNNGEAAVRKLPEFSPDLILADIFMPVRNGYEVCEFVKKDPRFARIPVVLLVGAFDPFDEREAQRVGADGILKKPFVPPDPLITMIKTLLDRSLGDRLVAVSASKPAAVVAQAKTGGVAVADAPPQVKEADPVDESSSPEFPRPVEHIAFGEGEHPVAFGQLLETPVEEPVIAPVATSAVLEPVDDEQILTSTRPATLGDPIFWRNDSPKEEIEATEPEHVAEIPESRSWEKEDSNPRRDETPLLRALEPMELVRDEQDEHASTVVDSKRILLDAAAQAPLNVESGKPSDLAANPLEWMATAPAEPVNEKVIQPVDEAPACDEPIADPNETVDKLETLLPQSAFLDHPAEALPPVAVESPAASVSVPVVAHLDLPKSDTSADITQEFRPVKTPEGVTETPVEKSVTPVSPVRSSPVLPTLPPPSVAPNKLEALKSALPQSVMDTARSLPVRSWADLAAPLTTKSSETANGMDKFAAPAAPPAATDAAATLTSAPAVPGKTPDPELVEAVVQRVLDKMRPQVVEIITKEFLRPIVQALVHREIEKP